jgi:hypothetical protein
MTKSPIVEFRSWRDPAGYRLIAAKPPELQRIGRKGHKNAPLEPWHPLDCTADLFLIFAKSATTPDGLLDFVKEFGPVMHDGHDPNGDIVPEMIDHARRMNTLLEKHWREPSMVKRREAEPPPFVHPFKWTRDKEFSPARLQATVIWDIGTKALQWQFKPDSLLNGLWLQLGMFLMRGAKLMVCEHCGSFFTAGIGTGRRVVARFCSDEHRIAFNSLKRSRESREQQKPRKGGRR